MTNLNLPTSSKWNTLKTTAEMLEACLERASGLVK
ncbi:hypothetical protein PDESU_05598 [Pontiella desulfatans]|uniref:Uncharacterized protein n=1 Tax=Pontiella desulfatans TaxID=2750659 RepID=A0A6C2UCB0_PONDE|nr:hypothetical protein PDESU_05598 [Pontiella desulfatans]